MARNESPGFLAFGMVDGQEWDRREEDRKWKAELKADLKEQIEGFEARLEVDIDKLGDEVERFKEVISGGMDGGEGLMVRLARIEKQYQEVLVITSALAQTIHGDVLGRRSLVAKVDSAIDEGEAAKKIAEDAKKIAEDALKSADTRVTVQTTRRGQNVSIWVAIISLVGVILMASLSNWDKIQSFFRSETPQEKLARFHREIERDKKIRGPQIQKMLKEIERASRNHY